MLFTANDTLRAVRVAVKFLRFGSGVSDDFKMAMLFTYVVAIKKTYQVNLKNDSICPKPFSFQFPHRVGVSHLQMHIQLN